MAWGNLNQILSYSGILTIIGAIILLFGKIILKARRELVKDRVSEVLEGTLFMMKYILIPILLLLGLLHFKSTIPQYLNFLNLISQFFIVFILSKILSKKIRFYWLIIFLFTTTSFLINYYFFISKNLINIITSILMTFLILILSAAFYGFNIPIDYTKLIKTLPEKTIKFENNEKIKAKIIMTGDKFIKILHKGKIKSISLSKIALIEESYKKQLKKWSKQSTSEQGIFL